MGKGITISYLVEKTQKWMGGAICPRIAGNNSLYIPKYKNQPLLVRHEIPIHEKREENLKKALDADRGLEYAINWAPFIGNIETVNFYFQELLSRTPEEYHRYYIPARDFYNKYRKINKGR